MNGTLITHTSYQRNFCNKNILHSINEQFSRALSVNRANLLFRTPDQKKKKKVIAPLVITYNPGNPKLKSWIFEEISLLHEDPKLRKIFPSIDVVTRQTSNIKRRTMKNEFTSSDGQAPAQPRPAGNLRYHDMRRSVCCAHMEWSKESQNH